MSNLIEPRELHGARLFGYSLGDLGLTLPNTFISVFLFQYYVYTINLDALFVSIGVSAQLVIGALFAIIFGVIVDNKKPGKFGKRRPFLLYGLPIWIITTILIWFPPFCPQNNSLYIPTAAFFWIISIIREIFRALIFNVYISMLPEQSQTLKNREKVASIRSVFSIIASIAALMLPLLVQALVEDPSSVKWWHPSGRILLFYIPFIGISVSIIGLISVVLIFLSVDESFYINNFQTQKEKRKVVDVLKGMAIPAKDRNYIVWAIVGFFEGVGGKIVGLLVIPFQTYIMQFHSSQFLLYIIFSTVGKFSWYFIWKVILKKNRILISYSFCVIAAVLSSFMDLVFLISSLDYGIKLILYIISWSTLLGSMYSFPLFAIPITAALVQDAAVKNNKKTNLDDSMSKISGSYYGFSSFINSLGIAFASLFVGVILSGSNEENPLAIMIIYLSLGIFYSLAFIFIKKVRLSKDSYYNN
jgi:Na+/melibiose symporter-like transporter